jgi:hypothetical protein
MDDSFPIEKAIALISQVLRANCSLYADCKISFAMWKISRIRPLSRYLVLSRLDLARDIAHKNRHKLSDIFEPVLLFENGAKRLTIPPIIEIIGQTAYVVDGCHRIFAAREAQVDELRLITIENVNHALPVEPYSWDKISIDSIQRSFSEILPNCDSALFRPTHKIVNSNCFLIS